MLLAGRTLMLRKRGIKAIVFGETDHSDFLLLPIFFVFVYIVVARSFNLPMPNVLIRPFWMNPAAEWLGFILCMAAVGGSALSLKSFGNSFRVGIDKKRPNY